MTTTLEKIARAFFSPKGMNVYWKQPYFVVKLVLLWSSDVIVIWWYLKNPSVNRYAS